jgi:hypothetical protein
MTATGLTITAGSRAFSIAGFEIGNGSIELSLLFFHPVVLAFFSQNKK